MRRLKKSLLLLSLFAVAFTSPQTPHGIGQTTSDSLTAAEAASFQPGEEITYKIYYNWNFVWLPAGEVRFKVIDEGETYHFQATGKTYPSYEWFFKARDTYDSWVDKKTLLPVYSEREINEGSYSIFEKIKYDQDDKKTTVWRANHRGAEETKTEHALKNPVHDILSSLYYLRSLDLASKGPGAAKPFTVFMDKEEYPLKMRFVGKESRKKVHGMGHYRTQKFQPDVIAGNVFSEEAKMTVWVSDDQNRIPVLIESPVSVGSVQVVLKAYKGLKFDFTAAQKE
jgi:hypothetical protein